MLKYFETIVNISPYIMPVSVEVECVDIHGTLLLHGTRCFNTLSLLHNLTHEQYFDLRRLILKTTLASR